MVAMVNPSRIVAPLVACCSLLAAGCSADGVGSAPEALTAVVHERLAFDDTSFTQGLEVAPDGTIVVGTGWEGQSRVYRRTVDGEEVASAPLDPTFFGEGITLADAHLIQLTWQNQVAVLRDPVTLEERSRASYDGEGWGICYHEDADEVIFSDGSAELRRMDPVTLEELERFTVTRDGTPVDGLNELECVGDSVYANIFTTTDIVRIDARTGKVTAVIDASGVPNNAAADPNNVLNGIAHIPGTSNPAEFYITGKRWPDLYRVTFDATD